MQRRKVTTNNLLPSQFTTVPVYWYSPKFSISLPILTWLRSVVYCYWLVIPVARKTMPHPVDCPVTITVLKYATSRVLWCVQLS